LFDPEGFNAGAERAIFWTRRMLETGDREGNERRWAFLGELPRVIREPGLLFVHGSARNPLNEYVFPEDIHNQRKMERIFSLVERHCFQGHTHIPGVFTEDLKYLAPEEIDFRYVLGDSKCLVNVGSVGQPRNGDPRSSYAVLSDPPAGGSFETSGEADAGGETGRGQPVSDPSSLTPSLPAPDDAAAGSANDHLTLEFRRVEYDVEITAEKIYAVPDLDNFLGDRIRDGR